MNVHSCLVDFGASSNAMPYTMCKKINAMPQNTNTQIIQLGRIGVRVMGEIKEVVIILSLNPMIFQVIDNFFHGNY